MMIIINCLSSLADDLSNYWQLFLIFASVQLNHSFDVMFNKRVGVFYHNIKHDA
jgi:hypothetical protein